MLRTMLSRLGPDSMASKDAPMLMPRARAAATKETPRMEAWDGGVEDGIRIALKEEAMAYCWKAALRRSR